MPQNACISVTLRVSLDHSPPKPNLRLVERAAFLHILAIVTASCKHRRNDCANGLYVSESVFLVNLNNNAIFHANFGSSYRTARFQVIRWVYDIQATHLSLIFQHSAFVGELVTIADQPFRVRKYALAVLALIYLFQSRHFTLYTQTTSPRSKHSNNYLSGSSMREGMLNRGSGGRAASWCLTAVLGPKSKSARSA